MTSLCIYAPCFACFVSEEHSVCHQTISDVIYIMRLACKEIEKAYFNQIYITGTNESIYTLQLQKINWVRA